MSYFTGVKITDVTGVNVAAVKPSSTPPSIVDPALVVAISPNLPGPAPAAMSLSVVFASDQPAIPVSLTSPFVQINNEALNPVPVSVVAGVDANIRSVGNAPYSLGANVSANSMPVTIASDQSAINVNIAGGAGNAAAGLTGSPVPASADYQGVNIGGNLVGVTGFSLTNAKAEAVAIVDGSGNQITSFGGGVQFADAAASGAHPTGTQLIGWNKGATTELAVTARSLTNAQSLDVAIVDGSGNQITTFGGGTQFADNQASGATPTGTLSMGWDSTNSVVRALKVDPNQNLNVTADGSSLLRQEIRETNAWLMKSYLLFGGDTDTIGSAQITSTCVQLNAADLNTTNTQGNSGTNAQSWWAQIGDTVNGPVAVKPAINTTTVPPTFTTAGATNANPALTTMLSPNSGIPAIIQKTSGTGVGSQTSLSTANFSANVTAGNSIVVVVGVGNNGAIGITDTLGNSYTQARVQANGTTFEVGIFFATNIKGGTNAVTVTPSASVSLDIVAYEVSGIIGVGGGGSINTTPSIINQQGSTDVSTGSTGTSTTPASGSGVVLFPNEIAFGGIAIGTAAQTPSAFTPWNKDFTLSVGGTPSGLFSLSTFSQNLGAPGATVSLTATIVSEPWAAAVVTFKPMLVSIGGVVTVIGPGAPGAGLGGNPIVIAGTNAGLVTSVSVTSGGFVNAAIVGAGTGSAVDGAVTAAVSPLSGVAVLSVNNTTAPSLTTGQSVAVQSDYQGSVFVKPYRRGQTVSQATTIAVNTITTILAAQAAGIFADISNLIISPIALATAASATATLTDGTKTYIFDINSGTTTSQTGLPVNIQFNPPLPASTAATAWQLTMSTTNTVHVTVVAVLQKAS